MSSLIIKPKLFCNVFKFPISLFENSNEPLTYIGKKIIKGNDLEHCWNSFKKDFSDFDKIKTLTDLYQLKSGPLDKFSADTVFHPWIHRRPNKQHNDICLSIFKNKKRFIISYNKMLNLISSIKSNGYDPTLTDDRQGGIVGYFLSSGHKVQFYVNAGNHRAATIKCLGIKSVPCLFQDYSNLKQRDIKETYLYDPNNTYFIRDYNTNFAASWPAVESGFIDKETAIIIANRYVHGY
jgi:hypothetical protein